MAWVEKSSRTTWRVRYWKDDGTLGSVSGFTTKTAADQHATDAARPDPEPTSAGAISAAARQVAHTIHAAVIATFTATGSTTLRVARERPDCPILGLTGSEDENAKDAEEHRRGWELELDELRDYVSTHVLGSDRP